MIRHETYSSRVEMKCSKAMYIPSFETLNLKVLIITDMDWHIVDRTADTMTSKVFDHSHSVLSSSRHNGFAKTAFL